jgi:hypothetical protein
MSFDVVGIEVDFETILKPVPIVVAAVTAAYKLKDVKPRRRASLKSDLELLKMASDQGIPCADLTRHINAEFRHLYVRTGQDEIQWVTAAFGALCLLVFSTLTAYVVRDGFSGWALVTGYFAVAGLGITMRGLDTGWRHPAAAATE